MFAIAFDMTIGDLKENFGNPYNNAYYEIRKILRRYDFHSTPGSVYLSENEDMANLLRAMVELKSTPWFANAVRDIKAFRVEQWSDFTTFMKE